MCTAMQVEEFGGVYGNDRFIWSSVVCTVTMQVEEFGGVIITAMQVEEFDGVYGNAGRGVRWCVRQCR